MEHDIEALKARSAASWMKLVGQLGADPFFLAPDATAIRPFGTAPTTLEQVDPMAGRLCLDRLDVVFDVEQRVAGAATVDRTVQRVLRPAFGVDTLKLGVQTR